MKCDARVLNEAVSKFENYVIPIVYKLLCFLSNNKERRLEFGISGKKKSTTKLTVHAYISNYV